MAMERNKTLGFAVATMEAGLLTNETFVRQLRGLGEPVVIVNQCREKDIDPPRLAIMSRCSTSKAVGCP